MKKVIPMPEFQPPPKKQINELLSQETQEAIDHNSIESLKNARTRDWAPQEQSPTRPDLYKKGQGDGE